MSGNFGHFFVYAPASKLETRDYGVARYGMEVQRLCHVLNSHMEGRTFIVGEEYSIADIICFPWFHQLRVGYKHSSGITQYFRAATNYSTVYISTFVSLVTTLQSTILLLITILCLNYSYTCIYNLHLLLQ